MAPLFLSSSLFLIVVFSVWYYKYAYSNNQQNVDGLSGKVEILKEIRINREKLKTGELDKEEFEKIESELTDKWIN